MSDMPPWLQEVDHTGDTGIIVEAEDIETLYARAAWGLFNILTDLDTVTPEAQREISVAADDPEALMVRWLSDLNFIHITEGWLFNTFDVDLRSTGVLTATVHGEQITPDRHPVYTEVKAVTFHGMYVRKYDEAWQARIIFDM